MLSCFVVVVFDLSLRYSVFARVRAKQDPARNPERPGYHRF